MRIIPRTAAALVLATSLVGVSAWAQSSGTHAGATRAPGATQPQGTQPQGTQPTGKKLSAGDQQFFHDAYSDATAELAIGQLAANNGATDQVKKLGQTMVNDSTKQLDGLRGLAQKDGVTVPSGMNAKDQDEVGKLSKLQGPQFDKAFLQHVRTREQTVLREMQQEAKNGKNPDLKSWANGEIAVLRSHVDEARNIGVTAPQPTNQPQKQPPPPKK